MDKPSKIIFGALIVLVSFSIVATYYRVLVKRDYVITSQVSCDPISESCFAGSEEDGELPFYKIVKKKAAKIPFCDPHAGECPELSCAENESDCEVVYCDQEVDGECGYAEVPEPPEPKIELEQIEETATTTANE